MADLSHPPVEFAEGVGIKQGNPLVITCGAETIDGDHPTYEFMAGTRGSETDFTVYAWSSSLSDSVDDDSDLFQSEPANTLVTVSEAVKAVITGGSAIHTPMGSALTYTVQLRDVKGNDVGPTPGENNYFSVQVDTYVEGTTPNADGLPVPNGEFDEDDFTRIRSTREPDSSGQFTIPVGYRDPTRVINNGDANIQVTISTVTGNGLYVVDMTTDTTPVGRVTIPPDVTGVAVTGLTADEVRFSDNAATPTSIDAGAATWRLRAPRNRNSVTVTVKDQYGARYRGGTHQVAATDETNTGDFPTDTNQNEFAISSSGRRSIGYTHTGVAAQQQTITVTLQTRRVTGGNAPAAPVAVEGATDDVTVLWADRGALGAGDDLPILLGDPGSNHILINSGGNGDTVGASPR